MYMCTCIIFVNNVCPLTGVQVCFVQKRQIFEPFSFQFRGFDQTSPGSAPGGHNNCMEKSQIETLLGQGLRLSYED